MTAILRLATVAAVAASAASCAAASADMPVVSDPAAETITVDVRNDNWADVNVYAVRPGFRARLGTVTSMTTRRLTIPRHLASAAHELELVVDPIGSQDLFRTGPIEAFPGDRIHFSVGNYLPISSFSVLAARR